MSLDKERGIALQILSFASPAILKFLRRKATEIAAAGPYDKAAIEILIDKMLKQRQHEPDTAQLSQVGGDRSARALPAQHPVPGTTRT